MGTLSSFSFSLISPNGCNFRDKFQNNRTKCLLCGEILLKRRRRLVAKGDFRRLNSVIRYCYNGENDRSDDTSTSSGGDGGERESKENSNLATMAPAEKKSEDNADDPPASESPRASEFFSILCFKAGKMNFKRKARDSAHLSRLILSCLTQATLLSSGMILISSCILSSIGITAAPAFPPIGPGYSNFQVDSFKLMELLGPEKVDTADVKVIKDKLFGYSTFWVTREEPFGDLGEGVLFLGNLRGKREDVFSKLQTQLKEIMGDKYNLFMVEEPNSEGEDPRGGPRVSFGMLRKEVSEPGQTTLWQYVIAFLLFLLTIGSSVELGIASQVSRLPPEIVKYFTDPNAVEPPDMQQLVPFVESALPLAYGVLGVQLFHEVGHFFAAFPRNVKLSIPYFIPNITLGSFGAITQFKSILPDRKAKVDISLVGPFAGAALSFSMFAVGLLLSSNPSVAGDLIQVPSMLFQGSLLLGLISRAVLGYATMHASTVSIHPLVIAGWCGLTTSAFNLLPVGCLDGGRAMQGAFGKNALVASGLATYSLLGLGVLGGPLSLPWGLYVLICQRTPEKPCLNDVSEVGTWRKAVFAAAIFLVVVTLLPVWDELAEELGIGLVTSL
ncbi:Peptidase M50 family protein [Perilla frutescens var. hirtella]|uniref:Peptidase M50 family protein n=1 Tax=Perilla frutescens var. hirtella TaxID=608512 RepID=A0AAD4NYW9_PERFH|nr:Peptidase M50 family protein [Perilla frutescens var. hirtella]